VCIKAEGGGYPPFRKTECNNRWPSLASQVPKIFHGDRSEYEETVQKDEIQKPTTHSTFLPSPSRGRRNKRLYKAHINIPNSRGNDLPSVISIHMNTYPFIMHKKVVFYKLAKFHLEIPYIQDCTKMTKSDIYIVNGYHVDQDPDSSLTDQP
jgi:hypothetical protein